MTTVRPLELSDVEHVVTRVGDRLARDAEIQPLVNPAISTQLLADSLRVATDQTWVADNDGVIVGHLYGAMLESETYGNGVWIGPDGVSFDTTDILSDLYSAAGRALDRARSPRTLRVDHRRHRLHPAVVRDGIRAHAHARRLASRRTARSRTTRGLRASPRQRRRPRDRGGPGRRTRRGPARRARASPSASITRSKRDDLLETLEDPEVHHYIVRVRRGRRRPVHHLSRYRHVAGPSTTRCT